MTYEQYVLLERVFFAIGGAFLILTIILFFKLKIVAVIGDLTGSTARKAIQKIREENEESGNKVYRSSTVNIKRGTITEQITESDDVRRPAVESYAPHTEKISTQVLKEAAIDSYMETALLSENNETSVLSQGNETTLLVNTNETQVLSEDLLLNYEEYSKNAKQGFEIEKEITFIHSDEVISA